MARKLQCPGTQPTIDGLQAVLLHKFRTLHMKPPTWAWQFPPSIPFIGRHYRPGKSLLVYASAENFAWMIQAKVPARFASDAAWNRYRAAYEDDGKDSTSFFPSIGIQPVTDGGLLAASLFLCERLGLPVRRTPRTFLETLAVSNWCKFAIQHKTNKDYITDAKKLVASLSFVVAELNVLRPAFVVLPQALWRNPILSAAMRGASPETCFVPLPQFNPTVVNTHLTGYAPHARILRRRMAGTTVAKWMSHLAGFNEGNAWRYLASLTQALSMRSCEGDRRLP